MATESIWDYNLWAPTNLDNWGGQAHDHWTELDPHVDLGCGTVKKARIGVDHYPSPGVNIVCDLNTLTTYATSVEPNEDARVQDMLVSGERESGVHGLPFEDGSIESIISHHCFEHIGEGFLSLMDEIYRVLKPGGTLRIITPLFPSSSAVADPDHRRYFMEDTFRSFEGHLGDENNPTGSWLDSFSVPYTKARFERIDLDMTPRCEPEKHWSSEDVREIRWAGRAVK